MPRDYTSKDYVNEAIAILNRIKSATSSKCSEILSAKFDENSSNLVLLDETIEFAYENLDDKDLTTVINLLSAAKKLDIAFIDVECRIINGTLFNH